MQKFAVHRPIMADMLRGWERCGNSRVPAYYCKALAVPPAPPGALCKHDLSLTPALLTYLHALEIAMATEVSSACSPHVFFVVRVVSMCTLRSACLLLHGGARASAAIAECLMHHHFARHDYRAPLHQRYLARTQASQHTQTPLAPA